MYKNRLKVLRKVNRLTQSQVAQIIGITQNTYSYWESGKVKIDNASLTKLARYYSVSIDFLIGRSYRITNPVSQWDIELQEEYKNADTFMRQFLEYTYGAIVYVDHFIEDFQSINVANGSNSPVAITSGHHNTVTLTNGDVHSRELSEIEAEILRVCEKLDTRKKALLLANAYELLES